MSIVKTPTTTPKQLQNKQETAEAAQLSASLNK